MSGDVKRALFLAGAILISTQGAWAQEIDDRVRPGMTVEVVDDQGERHKGRVETVTADLLRLSRAGDIEAIPAQRIVLIEKPLRVGNTGMVIGTIAGASLGIAAGVRSRETPLGPVLAAAILGGTFGMVGGGAGLLIDGIVHRRRTLYERPPKMTVDVVPFATSRLTGAIVSISW
jgi:hypothetical protein